jgi:demethylmenaquinone methyltransferase/2-methoxy-6-polyprenyl-1,4-benzoquinol methylase
MTSANKFLAYDETRADRVEQLFSRIARQYDLINDLQSFGLHRLWKRKLIKLAQFGPGQRGLDLCCGTGDLALGLRACAMDDVQVIGLDFSAPMLELARQREPQSGLAWVRGDAMRLPFPAGSFDAVTMGYGLRNVAHLAGALEEIRRVLQPGGRLLVLDFGKPDNPILRGLYFTYLRTAPPLLGKWLCGDADTHSYIYASLMGYPAQRGVEVRMQQAGWKNVRVHNLLGGIMAINYGEA